jgi:hypothetical protein
MWRTVLAEFARALLGPKSVAAPRRFGPQKRISAAWLFGISLKETVMLAAYALAVTTEKITSLGRANIAVVPSRFGDPSRSRELVRN